MSPFEYVIVLISIILGMGITQIVTGIADMVHQWEKVKVYWPHLAWIIIVFILHIQDWWATYDLRAFNSFRLPTFLFILLYPINLFILARVLFPVVTSDGDVDLKKFYYASYRKFFIVAAGLPVISMLTNVIVVDRPVSSQLGHASIFVVLLILIGLREVPAIVHRIFAAALLIILLATLAVMWNNSLT